LNTISGILFLLLSGLPYISISPQPGKFDEGRMAEPSIIGFVDNIFAFPDMESCFAGSDQNDDHNFYHNKTILFRVLPSGQKKLLIPKKKIFISPHSSSYFELDIPPPLLDV
jgi:hypothetical protein